MAWDYNIAQDSGFTFRDIYPTGRGQSTSEIVTGANGGMQQTASNPTPASPNDPVSNAVSIGGQGNPIVAGAVFFGFVFGLMFLARYLGTDDDFKAIKPSVYNVVTIALAATAGMPLLKYAATKFPIPGISTWVLAA